MAKITLGGNPFNTIGDLPATGSRAPGFKLTDGGLENVTLDRFKGKRKVLNIVPSLDTAVCAASTRAFNEKAAALHNTVVLVISADLPFAQKRFCESAGIKHVAPLSMMRDKNFAKEYGVLITDGPFAGLCARAVVVIDENDQVVYTELVPEIGQEPDYVGALAALG